MREHHNGAWEPPRLGLEAGQGAVDVQRRSTQDEAQRARQGAVRALERRVHPDGVFFARVSAGTPGSAGRAR